MRLYCLFDTIAEEAGPVFEARNDVMARRVLGTMKEENLPPGSIIGDFKLYKLGSYFHGDGKLIPQLHALPKSYDITTPELLFGEESEDEVTNEAV